MYQVLGAYVDEVTGKNNDEGMNDVLFVRRSRVIGDWGGYRRLIVDFAVFGREGLARKGSCKGGCPAR